MVYSMVNSKPSSTLLRKISAPLLVLGFVLTVVYQTYPATLPLWPSIGLITAWAGSSLLVASMLLMIREPHIAHMLGGLENMYLWHHRSGMLAYVLLLYHPLALAFNSGSQAPHLAWEVLVPPLASWQIWLGWFALLLMMVGLTSTFIVSLPYRCWRRMHMFLGAGVMLGLAHLYTLTGTSFPTMLLIVVTALALGWRLIASDLGAAASPYLVTQVEHKISGLIEVRLVPRATALTVTPGQFVLSAFGEGPHFHGCGEYHPFSVSSIENDGSLKLSIKALGPCSQHLQELEAGVMVRLQGPFGTFLAEPALTSQLWVAGGIGITPFIAVLRAHPCTQPTTLLYLFGNETRAAFLDELYLLAAADPKLEMLTNASDKGLPDFPALLDKVSQIAAREVYICGPQPMLDSLRPHLMQRKVSAHAIHFEKFDFR